MIQFAKITNGVPTTACAEDEDAYMIALLTADGFKPYDDSAPPPKVDRPSGRTPVEPSVGTGRGNSTQSGRTTARPNAVGLTESVSSDRLEPTLQPSLEPEPSLQAAVPSLSEHVATYRDDGERIVLEWKIVENSPTKIAAEIDRLKSALADSDYKVIQCSEYSLAGKTPPHDPAALHSSRQALRNRIGELEGLL